MVREPISCEPGTIGETHVFHVVYRDGDGLVHQHTFPTDTLAWRAHEYGIDATDVDLLLDIVLHEPYVPDGFDVDIYAVTAEAARAHHAHRIAQAKKTVTVNHRHPVFTELRTIHAGIVANIPNMDSRREAVAIHRKQRGVTGGNQKVGSTAA